MRRLCLGCVGLLLSVTPCGADTIVVALNGSGDFTEIQPAIDAASASDTVVVKPGEYIVVAPITLPADRNMVLRSESGADQTIVHMSETPLDPDHASVLFFEEEVSPETVVEGFTITGGTGSYTMYVGACPSDFDFAPYRAKAGGGIYCDQGALPVIANCRIIGNRAAAGGGVYCSYSAVVKFINCVIANNFSYHDKGDILFSENLSWQLFVNCTLVGGGSVPVWPDRCPGPRMQNCIILGGGPRCETCLWLGWSEAQFVDGTAGDYRLQAGSLAIDAGVSTGAPSFDMDGKQRPCGAGVDVGAYEYGPCQQAPRFRRGFFSGDNNLDLGEPAYLLSYLFAGGPAPRCLKAADVDDNGRLEVTDAIYLLQHISMDGPSPSYPFADCGMDLTIDHLTCEAPLACE